MSSLYAEGLSEYQNKGKCGVPEVQDGRRVLDCKIAKLADLIKTSKRVVVHTGAGISTSAGIPDFRGPNGVWTLEKQNKKPDVDKPFDEVQPTRTHMALAALYEKEFISLVVSQNIDGLHLRSGLPREALAELHGNILVSRCDGGCKGLFVRPEASTTVGQKHTGEQCSFLMKDGRHCDGKLKDTILDWDHDLPTEELALAEAFAKAADLSVVLGSSLQIKPAEFLPFKSEKQVICNLQPTKYDLKANVVIHGYVDYIMEKVCEHLGVRIPDYDPEKDPFVQLRKKIADSSPEVGLGDVKRAETLLEWKVCSARLKDLPETKAVRKSGKRKGGSGKSDKNGSKKRRGEIYPEAEDGNIDE